MIKTVSVLAVIFTLAAPGIGQKDNQLSPDLSSLVAAERAFAKTSVEKGVRASFIEFFSDDGIGFDPHPVRIKETYLKRQAPATPPKAVLDWKPAYADVSQAGDLGYTTGPYTYKDSSAPEKPTVYGIYFSIWKKQTDGSWKVVVDAGIQTPDHSQMPLVLRPAAEGQYRTRAARSDPGEERSELLNLDREFFRHSTSQGIVRSFLDYLSDDSRLHRPGVFPIIGLASIRSFLSSRPMQFTGEPIKADISRSADLGYTYGSYQMKNTESDLEKGYYVRVWKRNRSGKWKLALDTLIPIPPETK